MKADEKGISLSIWTLSWPIFIEVFLQLLVGNIDQSDDESLLASSGSSGS